MTAMGNRGDVVLRLLAAWERLDLNEVMSYLADDAVFLPAPKDKPVSGREAIGKLWAYYIGLFASYSCEVKNVVMSEHVVFVERVERIGRADGQNVVLPVAAVFEIDDAGKITAWRDYWDPSMATA